MNIYQKAIKVRKVCESRKDCEGCQYSEKCKKSFYYYIPVDVNLLELTKIIKNEKWIVK